MWSGSLLCPEAQLYFLLDAAQTAGSTPISMEEMGIDLLAFTGHKGLMGPRAPADCASPPGWSCGRWCPGGTGVRSFEEEQPAEYPEHLEAGTLNGHGLAGLGAAVDFILDTGVEAIHAHELSLTRRFVQGIRDIPGVTVYGDFSGDPGAGGSPESGGLGPRLGGGHPGPGLRHRRPARHPLCPPDAPGSWHPGCGLPALLLRLLHQRGGH